MRVPKRGQRSDGSVFCTWAIGICQTRISKVRVVCWRSPQWQWEIHMAVQQVQLKTRIVGVLIYGNTVCTHRVLSMYIRMQWLCHVYVSTHVHTHREELAHKKQDKNTWERSIEYTIAHTYQNYFPLTDDSKVLVNWQYEAEMPRLLPRQQHTLNETYLKICLEPWQQLSNSHMNESTS